MANIFISYHSESENIATALSSDIEALGHDPWFDQELNGGQAWWNQILESIRDCDVFIFVLTPGGLDSVACQREWYNASELGKRILPILPEVVADRIRTNQLPSALSSIQFVTWHKDHRASAFDLSRALSALPAASPLPNPLPVPPEIPLSYMATLADQIRQEEGLDYEAQSRILLELKSGLGDPDTKDDAISLLVRLGRRRDVLATIAREADELIRGAGGNKPPPQDRKRLGKFARIVSVGLLILGLLGTGYYVRQMIVDANLAEKESARLEAARLEAARLEAARLEAARLEAARLEAAKKYVFLVPASLGVKSALLLDGNSVCVVPGHPIKKEIVRFSKENGLKLETVDLTSSLKPIYEALGRNLLYLFARGSCDVYPIEIDNANVALKKLREITPSRSYLALPERM